MRSVRLDAWAVVPVKALSNAKRRLASALSAEQRRALVLAMLRDVLGTLSESGAIAGIMVVSPDSDVGALCHELGVRVMAENRERGYSEAANLAGRVLAGEGVRAMLVIPGDLPMLSGDDVSALVGAHGNRFPGVTVAPSRDGLGSNAILCSPPAVLEFLFGENSFERHLAAARDHGIEPIVVKRAGIGLDLDTRDDLRRFASRGTTTHTQRFLEISGVAAPATSA